MANSPQISSLLELDEMDNQDKEIKKAKVAVSLGACVNAAVQATAETENRYIDAIAETENGYVDATVETGDFGNYFNSAFHLDLENVIEDRSRQPVRPDVIALAAPEPLDIASSWGGSSRASSKTSTKASAIPDNWDEDLTPEQKERHDEMLNRYKKLPEDELRNIYEHITFKRAPTRITREDLIQHLLYYGYLSNY